MFAVGLFIITVAASLYIWGMVRTAIWIIPTLGFPELGPIFGASLLSFWTLSSFFIPHKAGFFDARDLTRSRWVLILISTGILAGSLVNPESWTTLLVSLLSTPFIILAFYLIKHPPSRSLNIPQKFKWLLLGLWIFCAILRILEAHILFT